MISKRTFMMCLNVMLFLTFLNYNKEVSNLSK